MSAALKNCLLGETVHYFIEGIDDEPQAVVAVVVAIRERPGAKEIMTENLYDIDLMVIDSAGEIHRAWSVRFSECDVVGTWNYRPRRWS